MIDFWTHLIRPYFESQTIRDIYCLIMDFQHPADWRLLYNPTMKPCVIYVTLSDMGGTMYNSKTLSSIQQDIVPDANSSMPLNMYNCMYNCYKNNTNTGPIMYDYMLKVSKRYPVLYSHNIVRLGKVGEVMVLQSRFDELTKDHVQLNILYSLSISTTFAILRLFYHNPTDPVRALCEIGPEEIIVEIGEVYFIVSLVHHFKMFYDFLRELYR
jgi:hypothetical protein